MSTFDIKYTTGEAIKGFFWGSNTPQPDDLLLMPSRT